MKAAAGQVVLADAMYYNDQPADKVFYMALARRQLGQTSEADTIFQNMLDYGSKHMQDKMAIDYFAVSLPDFLIFQEDLDLRHQLHCRYLMGLGYLGVADFSGAAEQFEHILKVNPAHTGATVHLRLAERKEEFDRLLD